MNIYDIIVVLSALIIIAIAIIEMVRIREDK